MEIVNIVSPHISNIPPEAVNHTASGFGDVEVLEVFLEDISNAT